MALLQSATTLCDIELDRPASEPFYRQLCKDLREAIFSERLPEDIDDRRASKRLRQHDLIAPPLSFYAKAPDRGGLVFGYTAVDEARTKRA